MKNALPGPITATYSRYSIVIGLSGSTVDRFDHERFVDAHHIKHWSAGGETSLDNLMLLCSRHHRLVHEGGFRIERDYQNRWFFKRPDGRAVPSCGYRAQDMIDDDIDEDIRELSTPINYPSAEGFFTEVKSSSGDALAS